MFRFAPYVSFISCLMVTVISAAEEGQTVYRLPMEPKAVVISYDEQNGFLGPRQNEAPLLSILADGTVQMPDSFGTSHDVDGKISKDELQSLLRFVIEENKFFDYDSEKVKAKMEEAQKQREILQMVDAPESVFEIRIADKKHSVRHYGIDFANEYKEVDELLHLHAIHRRLNKLMGETRVGGKTGIEKLLKLANEKLDKQHPGTKRLTAENFGGAHITQTGITYVIFSRSGQTDDGKSDGTLVSALLVFPKEGDPQITINVKTKP
jgi:hypothetical protein